MTFLTACDFINYVHNPATRPDELTKTRFELPGLYLHIPFCLQKCSYCNFFSVPGKPEQIENFLTALKIELKLRANQPEWQSLIFDTIYLGGGTPSLMTAEQMRALLTEIQHYFSIQANAEITVETNPETVTAAKLKSFRDAGINRLNIGIQSFRDRDLRQLNRAHTAQRAKDCLTEARTAGFDNLGLDLIFALPEQQLSDWKTNLELAIEFSPEHISAYSLTIEPGTPLAEQVAAGAVKPATETLEHDMYLTAIDYLTTNGYEHYEISNFAKLGFRSRHNQIYWHNEAYLGFGPAAHSYLPPIRFWNFANLSSYHHHVKNHDLPVAETEKLTPGQQKMERLFLGLRQRDGLKITAFENEFGLSFQRVYGPVIDQLNTQEQLLLIENGNLKLTTAGFLVYDEICSRLV